jgi:hypothetical protein
MTSSRTIGAGAPRSGASLPIHRGLALGLTAVAALLLTSCTSSGSASSSTGKAAGPSPSAARTTAAPATSLKPAILPSKIENQPTARKSVVQTSCAAIPGGWSAKGTATNGGKKAVTYKITVYFTTTHATTLNFATTSVRVPAGKTVKWAADKRFKAERQMLCPMPGVARVSQ